MMNIIKIDSEDCANYRKSLLEVIQAALLNEESVLNGFPSGGAISDCLDIVTCLEGNNPNLPTT